MYLTETDYNVPSVKAKFRNGYGEKSHATQNSVCSFSPGFMLLLHQSCKSKERHPRDTNNNFNFKCSSQIEGNLTSNTEDIRLLKLFISMN